MNIIKFCNKYIGNEKKKLVIYIFINIFLTMLSLIITVITSNFLDILVKKDNLSLIKLYCLYFGIFSIAIIALNLINNYLYTIIQTLISYRMNNSVIEHIKKLPRKEYLQMNSVYFNQRINNDSNSIVSFYINLLVEPLKYIILLVVSLFIIYKINKKILIFLLIFFILYVLLYIFFKDKLYYQSYKYKEEQADYFEKLNEQLEYIDFINIHSINKYFVLKLNNKFGEFFSVIKKYSKLSIIFSGLDQIIGTIGEILIYIIICLEIFWGNLSIGILMLVVTYAKNSLQSIKFFLSIGKTYQEILVSYDRLQILLNKPVKLDGEYIIDKINKIEIFNLTFCNNNKTLFNNLNLTMELGNLYVVKGRNGVGKTTLIKILLGMYNDYTGKIKFNGIDIRKLNMNKILSQNISFTEQEAILINDSILNNLILFNSNYNIEDLYNLLNIFKLKLNIDSYICENTTNISGGERQKIAIIRQILSNAEIMILDEPTSSIDEKSKRVLVDLIEVYKKEKLIIIISHSTEFDQIADEIFYLN